MEYEDKEIFASIQPLADSFSPSKDKRRSVFEIAGYPSWENVVTNMLAFYFNQDEQHNFGRTLFDALLRLLTLPPNICEKFEADEYIVQREKDYIDILITAKSEPEKIPGWAILIENKIKLEAIFRQCPVYP